MNKSIYLLIICFFLSAFTTAFGQTTFKGVTIPTSIETGEQSLVLNGMGMRTKLFFDLYVGALYLPAKSSDAKTIIEKDQSMSMRLDITSGMITSDKMSSATRDGFDQSAGQGYETSQRKIDQFIAVFKNNEIVKGTVFTLTYVPGEGVQTYRNGKLMATVPGLDFKKALFGIWLSNDPVQKDLKADMLGK